MTGPDAPAAAALHLWGPPALVAALADRLGPLAALQVRGDPLGRQLADLLAGNATVPPELDLPPEATGLVLYPGLAEVLAEALPGSGDATRGVAVWIALSGGLLAAWARQRRQVLLLASADLAADLADPQPDGPLAELGALTGRLPLGQPNPAALTPLPPPEMRLAAAALLQTLEAARTQQGRLAAASLPRSSPNLPDPSAHEALCAALEDGLRNRQAHERALALTLRRQEMAAETALQDARREAEAALAAETVRLAAEAETRLTAQAAEHAAETVRLAAEAETRLTAQAAALTRLGAALEALESLAAARLDEAGQLARDIAARDDRIRRLAEALQHIEDDLARLRASNSWRVTAPLRALSRATRRLRP